MRALVRFLSVFAFALAVVLPPCSHAAELRVGGTGSSGPLVHALFKEYRKRKPGLELRVIEPPLGSNGALRALEQGRIHLAVVGRPLVQEEYYRFGKHFDLADTPFVFASSNGQRRVGFSLGDLAAVYRGQLEKWDDGAPIRLVLRAAFESDTLLISSMGPELAAAQEIARARPGMFNAVNDLETVLVLAGTPGSFGPTTLGLLTSMNVRLQVYPLGGVSPSVAHLKDGSYPWKKRLTVVLPQKPAPEAEDFASYMRSAEAREVLLRNDYLAVQP